MKILVTGGRNYTDRAAVYRALDRLRGVDLVIHGGAYGADLLADDWARERGVERLPFPVSNKDWVWWGPSAGPRRNQRMVDEKPDLVVAFPGQRGTADCVRRARVAGIVVWEPEGPYPSGRD